ncbi:MAG: Gfo/Idh/MocA family oxidoreductase [Rhodospirillales bacterium]|nr:Gfo/Idh/MocA family oxidoreductase [Rhodospirillales bacterium]
MRIAWGIIGAGKIAERQMVTAMAQAADQRLVAVMKRDRAAAQRFAAHHDVPRFYDTVEALLADTEINAVYVATPPSLHAEHTLQAAAAGKHVLCEKPLALNSAQAQQMSDGCRTHGVQLMVCYYQRYNTRHQQIKQLLAEGAIGQVTAVRLNFSDYFPPTPGYWHHEPAISGGGPLVDLGIHCVDLLRYLCGEVTAVTALVDNLAAPSPVEDTATLLLKLANGAQAVITSHWSTASFEPQQSNGLEISGTLGTIQAAPISAKDSSGTLRLLTAAGVQDFSVAPGGVRPHVALLRDFANALAGNAPVPIPGEEGVAGLRVIEAAYRSAQSGRLMRIDDTNF